MGDLRAVGTIRRGAEELGLVFSLLSRLPVPSFDVRSNATLASAAWAFPVVAAVIGAIGALTFGAALWLGLGAGGCVLAAMAAMVLVSGGLHEDGLADFWDGIGGGDSPQSRLSIMRDSRIGTFGVLALVFCLGLQAALLWELAVLKSAPPVPMVLIAIAAMSRAVMAVPLGILPAARDDGLSVTVDHAPKWSLVAGVTIAVGLSWILLGPMMAVSMFLGSLVAALAVSGLAYRYLGGHTGDVLGATASLAMLGGLIGLAIGGGDASMFAGPTP